MTETARLMPTALRRAVGCSIRRATEPGSILHHLLNQRPKMIVCLWHGDSAEPLSEENDYSPKRGDGSTLLVEQGSPLFNLRDQEAPEHSNWIQGVPLWLLETPTIDLMQRNLIKVRGYGLIHPLLNTATLDYYDRDGAYQWRQYIYDPRLTPEEARRTDKADHFRQLQDAGAWIDTYAPTAPAWRPAGSTRTSMPWWRWPGHVS